MVGQTILNIRLDHQMTGVDSIFSNMVIYLRGSLGFGASEKHCNLFRGKLGLRYLLSI